MCQLRDSDKEIIPAGFLLQKNNMLQEQQFTDDDDRIVNMGRKHTWNKEVAL